MGYRLRAAVEADLGGLLAILNDAVEWLQRQGLDQWGGFPWHADELRPAVGAGELFLAETDAAVPVATMVLSARADEDFWTQADDPSSALYLSHLAADRSFSGVGAWMLDQAGRRAADSGKSWLRLDAWKSNARLHDYYRRQGFQVIRTVDAPDVTPGRCSSARRARACFEVGQSHSLIAAMWTVASKRTASLS